MSAFTLAAGQAQRLALRPGERMQVLQGRVWLTTAGDAADHLLGVGHVWGGAARSDVVIEAVQGPARVCRLPPQG